eukprot:TRINITY_DN10583_c0_g1_i1.p1 TRINITY_DN10583_c0_g1~~TRINITY_DN10583_c0_g1_i1.p1  ORF type:complete len:114 (-),score=0.75 TRINITY_DN10583_c0_g1_i1:34-375(-)
MLNRGACLSLFSQRYSRSSTPPWASALRAFHNPLTTADDKWESMGGSRKKQLLLMPPVSLPQPQTSTQHTQRHASNGKRLLELAPDYRLEVPSPQTAARLQVRSIGTYSCSPM